MSLVKSFFAAPVLYSAALLAAAFAAPQISAEPDNGALEQPNLGELKTYKDWTVGCDNGGVCEAISLIPENTEGAYRDFAGSLRVQRAAGEDDKLNIKILIDRDGLQDIDRYKMMIDGKLVDTGPVTDGNYSIKIVEKDARKALRDIASGRMLKLIGPDDMLITKISLAGSAAALRYMDSFQKRSGTPTALLAKGRRAYNAAPREIPSIRVDRWPASQIVPATQDIVALVERSKCSEHRYGLTEEQVFPLGQKNGLRRALVLVSCGSGAYNFASAAYIGVSNSGDDSGQETGDGDEAASRWTFRPARFDLDNTLEATGDLQILTNASWDAEKQILGSYNKGRGLADCGQAMRYMWDGEMFRLIKASQMRECRGSLDWITTWRADYSIYPVISQK